MFALLATKCLAPRPLDPSLPTSYTLGFYRTLTGQAEKWTLVPVFHSPRVAGDYVETGDQLLLKNVGVGGYLHAVTPDALGIHTPSDMASMLEESGETGENISLL